MVLEAVMICIDNSEWSRNGDYSPSRFDSESESANLIASAKIQSNPETSVGILSLAGNNIQVHVSLTRNNGQIMNALAKDIKIQGKCNLLGGLKTASLALKNRQNKNQRQRIIAFIGSPIEADIKELVKLGKSFKKNNIAVDCINFGTENSSNENAEKLEQFIAAVNAADNSHLINIPPGPHILADMILTSPIMADSHGAEFGGVAATAATGPTNSNTSGVGGIDPNVDPEMAMAIRMSMEEEKQRQERLTQAAQQASVTSNNAGTNTSTGTGNGMEEDEEALLQQAIAMSMQQEQQSNNNITTESNAQTATGSSSESSATAAGTDVDALMNDTAFINDLLSSVPGANPNDINMEILDQLNENKTNDNKDKDKDKQNKK